MKISRIYVRGFGKIEDFDMPFSDGLNVIYGPNESGKSTMMVFIKAMLYGVKGGRASKEGALNEAKRYKPWSKADYGGYINFELDNGKSYRIDRDFDKGDFTLYDQSFNDITNIYADNKSGNGAAEKLIGLNEGLFERTVYVRQSGIRLDTSGSKDLIDRISNIRESGSEDISYQKAEEALKEALKQQVGTDRSYTRPLDIINKRLEELNEGRLLIQEKNRSILEAAAKKEEIELQIKRLSAKAELFTGLLEFCEAKEKLKLCKDKKEEVTFLNERIKHSQAEISSLEGSKALLEQNIAENISQTASLNGTDGNSSLNNVASFEAMRDRIKKLKALCKVSGICGKVSIITAAIMGGLFFAGIYTSHIEQGYNKVPEWILSLVKFFQTYLSEVFISILAIIGLIFILSGFFLRKTLETLENQQSQAYERKEKGGRELDNVKRMDYILRQQLDSLNNRIITEKNQYEQLSERLKSSRSNYNQADSMALESEIDRLSDRIVILKDIVFGDLTCSEKEVYEKVFENSSNNEYMKLSEIKEFLMAQLQRKTIEKATVEAGLKKTEAIQDKELLENEISKLTKQKVCLQQRGAALNIAIKVLEESSKHVQNRYIPVMNKVFKDTFAELTASKYSDIRAGEGLKIMVSNPKTEMVVPAAVLSSGTIDQIYLALRIAISESVLKINESMPFIIDEPFSQYDDVRTDNALKCIYEISKRQQIVIFTCKQREVELISGKYPCKIQVLK
ncbi:AAA domain-containing protein [Ruminiclostridium sufflavum DSM 19573]|uniref:AAA domain-containing protein n=1 Tax=Ruminiclostridium sufflavum DSM 19573 TaxID=1121337 RepID=A0A318XRE3_9FIRM|nr:AAA family ATPase [Ruminiclostridium sufflavum]PYG89024.1 AAA domain-containing protein [Ruminiclostridium sufflavum DSM 19573]